MALFNPKKGKFNVTDKGGMLETDHFDWRVAQPYLVLAALNVAGLAFAAWRFVAGPPEERVTVVVSSLWVVYNLLVIGGAVAVAAEAHQVRKAHRVTTLRPAALRMPDGGVLRGVLHDYSSDGVGIELPGHPEIATGTPVTLLLGRGDRGVVHMGPASPRGVLRPPLGDPLRHPLGADLGGAKDGVAVG